jgi:hypothetical protein
MTVKWDKQNKSKKMKEMKGYLKILVAVNIKTKKSLALEVNDDKIYEGKEMKALVEHILKRNNNNKIIKSQQL